MPRRPRSSNREDILCFIYSISGERTVLATPRLFIDLTGSLELAVMLHQLLYWSDRAKRKDGYVYKSSVEWQKELGVKDHTVRKFNKLPYIETVVHRANGHPTNHYHVRLEELKQALLDVVHKDLLKSTNGSCENEECPIEFSKPLVEFNEAFVVNNEC